MTTRDDLIIEVVAYSKRADLQTEMIDFFLPKAEARIGRDLKSGENETELDIAVTTNPFPVPDDYGQIRALERPSDRGPFTMVSVDLHTINRLVRATENRASSYLITGKNVHLSASESEVTMFYYNRPFLATGSAENAVLDRWPQVYLYGTLVELHIFERDDARATSAAGLFDQEIARINRDASRARGDKPAMRRV